MLGDLTTSNLPAVLAASDALVHTAAAFNPTPGASDGVDNVATVALLSRAGVASVCVACLSEPRTECRTFDLTSGATGIADALRGL